MEKTLEEKFEEDLRMAVDILKKKKIHNPRFEAMLNEHGGVETAIRLIEMPISDGFTDLLISGLEKFSLEASMLKPEFQPLFTDSQLKIAKERMKIDK